MLPRNKRGRLCFSIVIRMVTMAQEESIKLNYLFLYLHIINIIVNMNRKTVTYTSTLPNIVMEEVVEYAKRKRISKNKVIEIALKKLLEEEIKNDLRESFKKSYL